MNWNVARSASLAVLGVLILAMMPGCFSLGRTSPTVEQYVIGGAEPAAAVGPVPGVDGVAVGLRGIDLAPYLATRAIVVRRGSHEVVTSDYHRWGEDLAEGINRALARHLAATESFRAVDVAPWPVRTSYDYVVRIHITRFEGVVPGATSPTAGAAAGAGEGASHVGASWEIIRQQDGTVLARGATEHVEEGWVVGDYAALVALLDEGLAVLAREVTAAIRGLAVKAADASRTGADRR